MEYKYTGIILNKREVGETDRIHVIYTLEGGKVRSLAKGVRKAEAKLAPSLENITLSDITIVRTKGLGKITGSIVENNFSALKKDCDALLETFLGLGIFDKLVDYENPDKEVFELLRKYLQSVDDAAKNGDIEKYVTLRLGFVTKLLNELGYTIEVNVCVLCGEKLSPQQLFFSCQHGGTLCQECAHQNSRSASQIHSNAIKLMRLFLQNDMLHLSKIQANQCDCDGARIALDDFLRWHT